MNISTNPNDDSVLYVEDEVILPSGIFVGIFDESERLEPVVKALSAPIAYGLPQKHAPLGGDPKFYSPLHHVLSTKMRNPMPADQVRQLATSNGITADEQKWSGLHKLEGKVTPEKALAHVQEHAPKVGVTVLGAGFVDQQHSETGSISHQNHELTNIIGKAIPTGTIHSVGQNENTGVFEHSDDKGHGISIIKRGNIGRGYPDWKLHSTILPASGGKWADGEREKALERANHVAAGESARIASGGQDSSRHGFHSMPGGENYQEHLLKLPPAESGEKADEYHHEHWDGHANVFAHIRADDRHVDGKKTFHIQELQSDWHQAGREGGYRSKESTDALESKLMGIRAHGDELQRIGKNESLPDDQRKEAFRELPIRREAQQRAFGELQRHKELPPDAPFSGDHWQDLAIRHAVHHAATNGYDRVSIGPSNIQNGEWHDDPGEGMVKNYDEKYPSALRKIGKQFGVELGRSRIGWQDEGSILASEEDLENPYLNERSAIPIHAHHIDITPAMREHFQKHGVPLWGQVATEGKK